MNYSIILGKQTYPYPLTHSPYYIIPFIVIYKSNDRSLAAGRSFTGRRTIVRHQADDLRIVTNGLTYTEEKAKG